MSVLRPELFPIHFIGIGGIGMSGIAEVFFNRGFPVSGSDTGETDTTRRLQSLGIPVTVGHHPDSVHGKKVVVTSSAIRKSNPEVIEAKRLRIPVIPRAEMLGELMRGKTGIALAGTHGKTTTTSLMSTVLTEIGWDPTCVIGGKVDALGGNAKSGKGTFVVAEADESDGSFLHLPVTYALVTNIDNDHLDHFQDQGGIDRAFIQFVNQLPFYGRAFLCGDDLGVKRILPSLTKPWSLYGLEGDVDFLAKNIVQSPEGTSFEMHRKSPDCTFEKLGLIRIRIPGRHNVLNALGVASVCVSLDIPFEKVAAALEKFSGVKRRFETVYHDSSKKIRIVDDYGHHPTEISATLKAARSVWDGRIICVFQPHRYSRTQSCAKEFETCFQGADALVLTEIYSAGEDPLPGVSGATLARSITASASAPKTEFIPTLEGVKARVLELLKPGDLVLCMGAGSITHLPAELKKSLT